MTHSRRTRILAGALIGVAVLVGLDFVGVLPRSGGGDPGADAAPSARDLYFQRAALVADQRRLIAEAPAWRSTAEDLRRRWDLVREGLAQGATEQLAGARFRDAALDALVGLDIGGLSATLQAPVSPDPSLPVRLLTLEVRFDARQHADLYLAVERLENIPGVRTSVGSVRFEGPGRLQTQGGAKAAITVTGLAVVGVGVGEGAP
ncbi:MAG TPA: hypothetical protein DEB06_05065 [Phycisphaerales bacterium]|nr:hypothetical protein [Phycisphaerales bacterium]